MYSIQILERFLQCFSPILCCCRSEGVILVKSCYTIMVKVKKYSQKTDTGTHTHTRTHRGDAVALDLPVKLRAEGQIAKYKQTV